LKRICFYTSDYGYGHAARDIAVINGILSRGKAEIFVRTDTAFDMMRRSLPGAKVLRLRNDIGVSYQGNSARADVEKTEAALLAWMDSWDDYLKKEEVFCREHEIDLILSDIVPQPFLVAKDLELPSMGISNFTWHYIWVNMRMRYGLTDDDVLIYLGLGRSLDPDFLLGLKEVELPDAKSLDVKFLVSSSLDLPLKNMLKIPPQETESQNYIAMCDLVVSKTGYSTASEAIRARVPMLLFTRNGYEEDKLVASGVGSLGVGREISEEEFLSWGWIEYLDDPEDLRAGFASLPQRFSGDGLSEALDAIEAVLA